MLGTTREDRRWYEEDHGGGRDNRRERRRSKAKRRGRGHQLTDRNTKRWRLAGILMMAVCWVPVLLIRNEYGDAGTEGLVLTAALFLAGLSVWLRGCAEAWWRYG